MQTSWLRLTSGGLFTALALLASPAVAQDHSIEAYLEVQAEADAAYATMNAMDRSDEGFIEAATQALVERTAAVGYLSEWLRAGTMPAEMVPSARETRIVLYQNIVRIYADLERCDDAASTLRTMDRLMEDDANATEIAFDALTEARTTSATCGVARSTPTQTSSNTSTAENGVSDDETEADNPAEPPSGELASELHETGTVTEPTTDLEADGTETSVVTAPQPTTYEERRLQQRQKERDMWGYIGLGVGGLIVLGSVGTTTTVDPETGDQYVQPGSFGGAIFGLGVAGLGLYYVLTPAPESGSVLHIGQVELMPTIGVQSVGVVGRW